MTTDLRHLLAIYVHAHRTGNSVPPHIDAEARTALADEPAVPEGREPASVTGPLPPAEGEVAELVADLQECADSCTYASKPYWAAPMRRAAELLQRQVMVPVSVSERPPEDQLCWWFEPDEEDDEAYGSSWTLLRICGGTSSYTHWLPAHALPIPQQQETVND